MKKIGYIFFLCLINGFIFSQQSNELFCKKTNRLYLVGAEPYENKTTFSVNYSVLKELHSNEIYPKYVLLESGHGKAFILNRYLESGDKQLFRELFILDTIERNYYTKLRALNLSLPDDRKFSFIGVNYDHDEDATHLALRYLLLSKKEFNDDDCLDNFNYMEDDQRYNYLICSFIDQRLSTERTKKNIELMVELLSSADSTRIIEKMGTNYSEAKLVLKGYLLGKERKNSFIYYIPGDKEFQLKRESLMLGNIYQLFSKDTTASMLGLFTTYSKLFMGNINGKDNDVFNTFAHSLNYDNKYPLTNNKICAGVIIYKNDLKRQSKDYKLNKNEFQEKYKKFDRNKLYTEQYTGIYPMINQLLFYKL